MNERIIFPESYNFLVPFIDEYYEIKDRMEKRKLRIKKQFQETYNMPRKLKKKRRKELEIDWQIANWTFGDF